MQRIALFCVGRLKEPFYVDAVAEYAKRLSHMCSLDIVEFPESRLPENPSPAEIAKALATERSAIEAKLPKSSALIAMCIEGKELSSPALAAKMADFATGGTSQLTFLIGGSMGLDQPLKNRANLCLSMSPMTFPHHLARVMLLEQIYRAYQIQLGTRYHK